MLRTLFTMFMFLIHLCLCCLVGLSYLIAFIDDSLLSVPVFIVMIVLWEPIWKHAVTPLIDRYEDLQKIFQK